MIPEPTHRLRVKHADGSEEECDLVLIRSGRFGVLETETLRLTTGDELHVEPLVAPADTAGEPLPHEAPGS